MIHDLEVQEIIPISPSPPVPPVPPPTIVPHKKKYVIGGKPPLKSYTQIWISLGGCILFIMIIIGIALIILSQMV